MSTHDCGGRASSLPFADALTQCRLCPRNCGVDRVAGQLGFCRSDDSVGVSAVVLHRGEEPVLTGTTGICNVFFGHCNLQCRYCQNVQISCNSVNIPEWGRSLEMVVERICRVLDQGVRCLGFVSPSHMAVQMVAIIKALHTRGYRPVVVYNSNGYDQVETLRLFEDWVDVYLPDFKYSDPALAKAWSGAADYPHVAAKALKEMYRQKGNLLHLDDEGIVERGLIVRHLVLPGATENSLGVLRFLASELSCRISLSLMSQYQPIDAVSGDPCLHRNLLPEEYQKVTEELDQLGFTNGWVQELDSARCYNPDFTKSSPFE